MTSLSRYPAKFENRMSDQLTPSHSGHFRRRGASWPNGNASVSSVYSESDGPSDVDDILDDEDAPFVGDAPNFERDSDDSADENDFGGFRFGEAPGMGGEGHFEELSEAEILAQLERAAYPMQLQTVEKLGLRGDSHPWIYSMQGALPESFDNLNCINSLQLISCNLRDVRRICTLSTLAVLDLSRNKLISMEAFETANLPQLATLVLDGNPITRVSKAALAKLPSLSSLSMVQTRVQNILPTVDALMASGQLTVLAFTRPARGERCAYPRESALDQLLHGFADQLSGVLPMRFRQLISGGRTSSRHSWSDSDGSDVIDLGDRASAMDNSSDGVDDSTVLGYLYDGDRSRFGFRTPLCDYAEYRSLVIRALPHLKNLDASPVTSSERARCESACSSHYERLPYARKHIEPVMQQLRNRELGSAGFTLSGRKKRRLISRIDAARAHRCSDSLSDASPRAAVERVPSLTTLANAVAEQVRVTNSSSTLSASGERVGPLDFSSADGTRSSLASSTQSIIGRSFAAQHTMSEASIKREAPYLPAGEDHFPTTASLYPRWTDRNVLSSYVNSFSAYRSSVLAEPSTFARQFEYNEELPGYMVYSTQFGQLVLMDCERGVKVGEMLHSVSSSRGAGNVLALSWLHGSRAGQFLAGSEEGRISLHDIADFKKPRQLSSGIRSRFTYPAFPALTSLHVNCTNEVFVTSGYNTHVTMYDVATGAKVRTLHGIHDQHINVLKFSHSNPNIFATSSFDRKMKVFDIREPHNNPLFSVESKFGNVMVCFSPDDSELLVSSVDNDVRSYDSSSGQLLNTYQVLRTGASRNYTRSYYMNDGDYIVSGSCAETVVRLFNARTAACLAEIDFRDSFQTIDPESRNSIYIQSLRGHPSKPFRFSALVSMAGIDTTASGIVEVDMLSADCADAPQDAVRHASVAAG